ncbi:hypothetical protein J2X31_001312 [Flavobacterium arsenatis]|uniref:DUF1905 domain-containing protein n=1 Tax=Flavobacterium arsenatis TaxID=1484332 RepID=A0ABU1TMW7_9FLAO|nr:hypothetical protein [Flavobacterium arsenatis]
MKAGGITFPFGLLKTETGMKLQKQMDSYLTIKILKIE